MPSLRPTGILAARASQIAQMREDTIRSPEFLDQRHLIHARMEDRKALNQFRNVRTRLLQSCGSDNAVVLVSAVGDGAGSTNMALNLAISFALDSTKTALIIDCNIQDPQLDSILDVEAGLGLTDYLLDDSVGMEAILYQTGIARLRLIPAGTHFESAAEFFTSTNMQVFLQALKLRYPDRFIVLHAPAIDVSADSRILASLCDMTILVTGYGRVSETRLVEAANIVGKERLAGIVVNQVPSVPFLDR
jgi:Mrp family chromosome partitioning ATPase